MRKKILILTVVAFAAVGLAQLKGETEESSAFNWRIRVGSNGCTECAKFELGPQTCNPATFVPECGRTSD